MNSFSITKILRIVWLACVLSGIVQAATYSAVITDLKTGTVLAQSYSKTPVYPASLTKLMTLYTIFQALEQGQIRMDTPLRVSAFAAKQPPSKWGLKTGSTISVRQCILALSVKSCNDVAHVVSENLCKTTHTFVKRMNATALKLGMMNTSFRNPSGWHHRLQTTTAYDMSVLMRAICTDFPQYAGFLGVPMIQNGNRVIRNTNKLLGRLPGLYLGKTGYTCPSGYNLVTVTSRNNQPIITVIMGMPSKIMRDQLMTCLIETCYQYPDRLHLAIAKPLKVLSKKSPVVLAQLDKKRTYKKRSGSKGIKDKKRKKRELTIAIAKTKNKSSRTKQRSQIRAQKTSLGKLRSRKPVRPVYALSRKAPKKQAMIKRVRFPKKRSSVKTVQQKSHSTPVRPIS